MPAWAGSGGEERLAPHPKIGRSWVRVSLFESLTGAVGEGVKTRLHLWWTRFMLTFKEDVDPRLHSAN